MFSSVGHLVHRSQTAKAILVEGHIINMHVKLLQNPSAGVGEEVV